MIAMSKKRRISADERFNDFDPAIEKLAMQRLLSGKQLFNYRTHRLHRQIRDEAQARAVLLRAETLAGELKKKLVMRYYERRLMNQAFEESEIDRQ